MAQFSYKARRRSGEVVQGVLDVADRTAALTQIERLSEEKREKEIFRRNRQRLQRQALALIKEQAKQ